MILKSVEWFLTRRFLKFSIEIYRENKPRPLAAMFFDESKWLEQSCKRITKGAFLQNYMEIGPVVLTRRFLKFSIPIYRENKPRPLAAKFFDESKWLEQSCKRITKETFLQNYIEISPVVSDKKIFKVFYTDI